MNNSSINFDTNQDPHGMIQWKGTNVCMDVYCKCGVHTHIDDEFVYYIECPNCKTIFEVNPHVQLVEKKLNNEEIEKLGGMIKRNYNEDLESIWK